jgi:hypothetical protein
MPRARPEKNGAPSSRVRRTLTPLHRLTHRADRGEPVSVDLGSQVCPYCFVRQELVHTVGAAFISSQPPGVLLIRPCDELSLTKAFLRSLGLVVLVGTQAPLHRENTGDQQENPPDVLHQQPNQEHRREQNS